MKLFIAYSGATSRAIAKALRQWLPSVLPKVELFFAESDVEKGAVWRAALETQIAAADVTLLCLTKEGLDRAWIAYEAGKSKLVYPLLIGLSADEFANGPLEQYQATQFDKSDLLRLIRQLHETARATAVARSSLDTVFARAWPRLEKQVKTILRAAGRGMLDHMQGGWWEWITTSTELTTMSFVQVQPVPGKDTLRLVGHGYGREGRPTSTWHSEVVLIDPERLQLAYLWQGKVLSGPGDDRQGIGQIRFFRSPRAGIESGDGSFEDTNLRDFYASKTFKLSRATAQHTRVMTGPDEKAKAALVRQQLRLRTRAR